MAKRKSKCLETSWLVVNIMFNKSGFNQIGKDIYVYHNFITEEECNELVKIGESFKEEIWKSRFGTKEEGHQWLEYSIEQLIPIHKRLSSILDDEVYLSDNLSLIRMKKGATWGVHSDNHDFLHLIEANKKLKDGEEFELRQNNVMGVVMYFNNFDGGKLYYTKQKIEYQPKKGDLVMHSSEEHCEHGVDELKSDIRYSHSNHLYKMIKVPLATKREFY